MRKFLEKLIAAKEKRAAELRQLIKQAETADEVRSLGDTLQAVMDELNDAKAQLDGLDDDQGNGEGEERGANPMHEFRQVGQSGQTETRDADRTDSVEYRTAFMNFVCRGVAMPAEFRDVTGVTDASAVIPTTLMNEIIKEMKGYGEIFARVRKMNVQGGVDIPVLTLKPAATWSADASATTAQKLQANDKVSFSYYGLECKVAQTLLVNVVTIDAFQQQFTELAAEAMVQALEAAIINGDGSGKPMGIVNDTRIPTANKVTLAADEFGNWADWKKKVFAKMKKAYRKGCFIMAQGTFDGYIDGMTDLNGQPIGRVNYGIADGETYRFGGKEVLPVENDILPDYESAGIGDVVAIFVNLTDYGVNGNMQMQVIKWIDHDTNEVKNKAIMICDGKLIDANGVILVKKGA